MIDELYGEFFRRALHPAWETRLKQRPTLKYWRALERTQWASRDELEAMQLHELRKLLRHAWSHVPFYRARMEQAGLAPDGVRTLDNLRRLPVLTRNRRAQNPAARRSTATPRATIRKATSGSTGRPLEFGYDANSEHWRAAIRLRGYGWAGYRPGDPSLHYWGAPVLPLPARKRAKVAADRWLRREHHVDCGRRGQEELQATVDALRRHRPRVLVAYTQAAADLARYVLDRDVRDWDTIPVICGAERLFAPDRAVIERAFGPAVFETYGSREVMLIASESEAHDGLLVQMENLIVEVVVRDADGHERPAAPGEAGEVVITDLHNLGMPFIRYANGNLAVAGPAGRSACGRAHQRLAAIEGRVSETLVDASGARVNGLVFNVVFASIGEAVRQFQAVQHRNRSVTLRVVPNQRFGEETRRVVAAVAARYLPGVPLRLETVTELPTSSGGKRRVVVVES